MVYPDRLEAIEKGNISSGGHLVHAAVPAFSDDVLADIYTEPSEGLTLGVGLKPHDDLFEDIVLGGGGDFTTHRKTSSTTTALSFVRSLPPVGSRGGMLSGEAGRVQGGRPFIGTITSANRTTGNSRQFASTIKAEI